MFLTTFLKILSFYWILGIKKIKCDNKFFADFCHFNVPNFWNTKNLHDIMLQIRIKKFELVTRSQSISDNNKSLWNHLEIRLEN